MSGEAGTSTVVVAATCFVCDDDFQTHRDYNKHMLEVHDIYVFDNEPDKRSGRERVALEVTAICDEEIEIIKPARKGGDGDDLVAPSTTYSNSAHGSKPVLIDLTESDSESDGGWIEDDIPIDAPTRSETGERNRDQNVGTCRASKTAYEVIEECLGVAAEKMIRSNAARAASESRTSPPRDGQTTEENTQRSSCEATRTTIAQTNISLIDGSVKKALLTTYKKWKLLKGISSSDMEGSAVDNAVQPVVSASEDKIVPGGDCYPAHSQSQSDGESVQNNVSRAVAIGQVALDTVQSSGLSGVRPDKQTQRQKMPSRTHPLEGQDITKVSPANQDQHQFITSGTDHVEGERRTEERGKNEKQQRHQTLFEVDQNLARRDGEIHEKKFSELNSASKSQIMSIAEHQLASVAEGMLANSSEDIKENVSQFAQDICKSFNTVQDGSSGADPCIAPTGVLEVGSTKEGTVCSSNGESSHSRLLQTDVKQLNLQGALVRNSTSDATSGSTDECKYPLTADTAKCNSNSKQNIKPTSKMKTVHELLKEDSTGSIGGDSSTADPSPTDSDARADSVMEAVRHRKHEEITSSTNIDMKANDKTANEKRKSALTGLLTGELSCPEDVPNFTCDICSLHFFNHSGLIEHNLNEHSTDDTEAVNLFADEEPGNGLTLWDLCTSDYNVEDVLTPIGTVIDVTEKYSAGGSTDISNDVFHYPVDNTATCSSSNNDLLTADQFEIHPSFRKRNLSDTPQGNESTPQSLLEGNPVEPDDGNGNNPLSHTKRRRRDSSDSGISVDPTMGGANQIASSRNATPLLPAFSPVESTQGRGIPQEGHVGTTLDKEGDPNYGLVIAEVKSLLKESQSVGPSDMPHNTLERPSTTAYTEQLFCVGICNERICSISVAEKNSVIDNVLSYLIKMCNREVNSIQFLAVATSLHVRSIPWLAMRYSLLRQVNPLKGAVERAHSCSLCGIYNFRDGLFAVAHMFSKRHLEMVVEFYWAAAVGKPQGTKGKMNSSAANTTRSDNTPAVVDTVKEIMRTASGSCGSTSADSSRCGISSMDTRLEGQTAPSQSHKHASHQFSNFVHRLNTTAASEGFPTGPASQDLSASISSPAHSQSQYLQQTNHEAMQRKMHPPPSAPTNTQSYLHNEHFPVGPRNYRDLIQHQKASSQRVPSVSSASSFYTSSGSYPSYNKPGQTITSERYPYVTNLPQNTTLQSNFSGTGTTPGYKLSWFQQDEPGQISSGDMKRLHMNTTFRMPQAYQGMERAPGSEKSGRQEHAPGNSSSGDINRSLMSTASGMPDRYSGTQRQDGHELSGFQQRAAWQTSSESMMPSHMNTVMEMQQGYSGTQGTPKQKVMPGFLQQFFSV